MISLCDDPGGRRGSDRHVEELMQERGMSLDHAQDTLAGVWRMPMLRKDRLEGWAEQGLTLAIQCSVLASYSPG